MDIDRIRGDTYADEFIISNVKTGVVTDISGCSLKLTLNTKRNPEDATTQVYQIVGDITDAVNGIVEFAPSLLQANRVGLYYYDIQLTDIDGIVRTVVRGTYSYSQDITKD